MKTKLKIASILVFLITIQSTLLTSQSLTTEQVVSGIFNGLDRIQDVQKLKDLKRNAEAKVESFRANPSITAQNVNVIREKYTALSVSYNHFFQLVKSDALNLRNITKIEKLNGKYKLLTDSILILAREFDNLSFDSNTKGAVKTVPAPAIAQAVSVLMTIGQEIVKFVRSNKEYRQLLTSTFDAMSAGYFEKFLLANFDKLWPEAATLIASGDTAGGSPNTSYGTFGSMAQYVANPTSENSNARIFDPNLSQPYTEENTLGGKIAIYRNQNGTIDPSRPIGLTQISNEVINTAYNAVENFRAGDNILVSVKTESLFIYVFGRDNNDSSGQTFELLYPHYMPSKPTGKSPNEMPKTKSLKFNNGSGTKGLGGNGDKNQYLKNLTPTELGDLAMLDANDIPASTPFRFQPGKGLDISLGMNDVGNSEQLLVFVSRSEISNPIEFLKLSFDFSPRNKNLSPGNLPSNIGALDYNDGSSNTPVLTPVSKIIRSYVINMNKVM
jgi:hypothetical protein